MADELELEPTPSAPRSRQDSPASPTSAQAATLVQAGRVPGFDPLEYAREHYMLTFFGVAFFFASPYGPFVFIQVDKPLRSSAPPPPPIAGSPPPPTSRPNPP